jgi:hypothetical protein
MSKISSTFISPCMLHVPSISSSLNCTCHWQAIWLKVRIIKLLDVKLPLSFSYFPASFSLTKQLINAINTHLKGVLFLFRS